MFSLRCAAISAAREAVIIGTVGERRAGMVTMKTAFGSTRIVDLLAGDQLPRIC